MLSLTFYVSNASCIINVNRMALCVSNKGINDEYGHKCNSYSNHIGCNRFLHGFSFIVLGYGLSIDFKKS